jgi:histidinol-phosphate aminotransferase
MLNRVRQPFNVTSLSLAAAQAALDDNAYLAESVALNDAGMQQLEAGFSALGLNYIESAANFITFETPNLASEMNQQLLQLGVIVRPVANYGLNNHLRVSIGLEDENAQFLQALTQILEPLKSDK